MYRKSLAQRAFKGLAGSPLAKAVKQSSDFTLREPKTPDREEPIGIYERFNALGERFARVDLDCDFQPYAFDRHLGRGAISEGTTHIPLRRYNADEIALGETELTIKKGGSTGLLEGERIVKCRRRTPQTWWIFDQECLKHFLESIKERDEARASSAIYVLYHYYFRNRQDEEIFAELCQNGMEKQPARSGRLAATNHGHPRLCFQHPKAVKNFRQRLISQGSELYPPSLWQNGRRGRWSEGNKCSDPNCACQRNEKSCDFSGR